MPLTYNPAPNLSDPGSKEDINNDAFYRVMMNFSGFGQQFQNVLYYRVGLGGLPGGINLGGADVLANLVKTQIWDNYMEDAVSTFHRLEDITVYPYNGLFDPMFSLPYVLPVNISGSAIGSTAGPAATVTVAFNLEGTVVGLNGWFPPKRGFISSLPYREGDVGDDGRLSTGAQSFYAEKYAQMAVDLNGLPTPVSFWPIRISTTRILDVITLRGFADIRGMYIRDIGRYRRSRLPEN